MIFDKLAHAHKYVKAIPGLEKALDWLKTVDLDTLELGQHKIDGERVLANRFDAKPFGIDTGIYEIHYHHVDFHVILEDELVLYHLGPESALDKGEFTFDPESDNQNFNYQLPQATLVARKGDFVIFNAHELHLPKIKLDSPKIKKLVIKIKVD